MNTFGLKRKVHTFWLGKLVFNPIEDAWEKVVEFTLSIRRSIEFILTR